MTLPAARPREALDPPRSGIPAALPVAAAVSVAVLVVALVAGGGAPESVPQGLPSSGVLVGWAYPLVRLVQDVAGMVAAGAAVVGVLLVPSRGGDLTSVGLRSLRGASNAAIVWALAAATNLVLGLSETLGQPLADSLSLSLLRSYARTTVTGQAQLAIVLMAGVLAVATRVVIGVRGGLAVAFLAVLTLMPAALAGHSSQADGHDVAVSSLLVHVVAASLWVGGLVALLVWVRRSERSLAFALPRFSTLALWCFASVAVSGAVNAWVRVGSLDAFLSTAYGRMALGKVAALVALGVLGLTMRRRVLARLPALRPGAVFARMAGIEVVVMAVAVGLAVALSRTPTPVSDGGSGALTAAQALLGFRLPALTATTLLTLWRPDVLVLVTLATLGTAYGAGVLKLRHRGVTWPWLRTISFATGLLMVAFVMLSGLGAYGRAMFSVHMVQHMVLTMAAPIFLVLAAPITLVLRACPAARPDGPWGLREWVLAVLRSRWFSVLSQPLVVLALYVVTLYAFYFSPVFEASQRSHATHVLVHAHFLLSGCLYFGTVLAVDPLPHRLAPPARLLLLLASLPFHAFFGVVILGSEQLLAPDWYESLRLSFVPDRVRDQQVGGGIAWGFGELPSLLVVIAVFVQWMRSDERTARRTDRRMDSGDDRSLEDYNAMLAALAEGRRPGAMPPDPPDNA